MESVDLLRGSLEMEESRDGPGRFVVREVVLVLVVVVVVLMIVSLRYDLDRLLL